MSESRDPTLNWGFLGASRIGRGALAPAVMAAGHRLGAVAARDLGRAKEFAADLGFERAYGDYQALIDDPAVEAVYIALPNDLHLPWTLAALAAGKHVLCEKPLALTEAEVARMQVAERASGKLVMEAFCHRFHPQFDRARSLLQQGAIGDLLCAQTHFVGGIADPGNFRWQASLGGGALYDLGCYGVSMLRSLLGAEPLSVRATKTNHGDVDSRFTATLDFPGGVTAQVFCSFDGARQQGMQLIGSTGSLTFDWPFSTKNRETTLTWSGGVARLAPCDPYVAMVQHFAASVAGQETLRFGLADSRAQAQMLDQLFAAAG
jgi:predicted dehydrogenase